MPRITRTLLACPLTARLRLHSQVEGHDDCKIRSPSLYWNVQGYGGESQEIAKTLKNMIKTVSELWKTG